jgi:Bacteriophage baseplate protein W
MTQPLRPERRSLDHPFAIGGDGRTVTTLGDDHVRDMIEQVLFTAPGERVMLPQFGCGLLTLVFEPDSDLLAAATELLVRGALQRWLGDVIDVSAVRVEAVDERLTVDVRYTRMVDGTETSVRIQAPGAVA